MTLCARIGRWVLRVGRLVETSRIGKRCNDIEIPRDEVAGSSSVHYGMMPPRIDVHMECLHAGSFGSRGSRLQGQVSAS